VRRIKATSVLSWKWVVGWPSSTAIIIERADYRKLLRVAKAADDLVKDIRSGIRNSDVMPLWKALDALNKETKK
jgi:hypothetical protein